MINQFEVIETNKMIEEENLDVRTITIGISLFECIDSSLDVLCDNIYNKIMSTARNLVPVGQSIEKYGIPIVNKRISVTPIATIGSSACKKPEDYVQIAKTLDKCAKELGINFIGGYTAIVSKGMTKAERMLIESIPQAMKETEFVCSSVNVGSTKTGINMDAVALLGQIVKRLHMLLRILSLLAVLNLLSSVMPQMITHLWLVHSMVSVNQTPLLMLVSVVLVLCIKQLRTQKVKTLVNYAKSSRKLHLRSLV